MADKEEPDNKKSDLEATAASGNKRMEEPTPRQRRPQRRSRTTVVTGPVSGFAGFVREHAIVGLAVGFVIAQQAQSLIKQLISSFIDPLIGILMGTQGTLSDKVRTFHYHGHQVNFLWGSFVYQLIYFILVLGSLYAIIKIFQLDKLDKKVK